MDRFHTTVTERGEFKTCRRKWYYATVLRQGSKGSVPWNLLFGTAVHKALEVYYTKDRKIKPTLTRFRKEWNKLGEVLEEDYGALYDHMEEEWTLHYERGQEMLTCYETFDHGAAHFKGAIAEVNVEERSFVSILDPETREELPGRPLLSGAIDLVVKTDKTTWLWDHKTYASPPNNSALDVDDQLTGYCYIYWRIFDEVPTGAIFNVLIKDPPKPPRVLNSGELSKDKSQRTTFELYLAEVNKQGLDIVDYEEVLNALAEKGWDKFFIREGVSRSIEELLDFEHRLYYEYKDMQAVLEDPDNLAYTNASVWNCGGCPVMPICRNLNERNDIEWIIDQMYITMPSRHTIPKGA